jgi:hypothetical protein
MGKVIEARRWRNPKTGRTASVYGSVPWTHEADRADWLMESVGWTIQHPDGTVGIGRAPFETAEQAQAWIAQNPRFPGMRQD